MIYSFPPDILHSTFVQHLSPILMLQNMKCAEQVRSIYGQVQMWKAIYCYIISTCLSVWLAEGSGAHAVPCKRKLKLVTLRSLARRCFQVEELEEKGGKNNTAFSLSKSCRQTPSRFHEKERKTLSSSLKASPSTGSPPPSSSSLSSRKNFQTGRVTPACESKHLSIFFRHHLDDLNHSESGYCLLRGPEILHRCS